jgi:hypothetical protein
MKVRAPAHAGHDDGPGLLEMLSMDAQEFAEADAAHEKGEAIINQEFKGTLAATTRAHGIDASETMNALARDPARLTRARRRTGGAEFADAPAEAEKHWLAGAVAMLEALDGTAGG